MRALQREAPGARAGALRQGHVRGQALRRAPGGHSPAHRPRAQPKARRGPARRRPVHVMRHASPRRRGLDVRAVPDCAARVGARDLRRQARGRAMRSVRGSGERRRLALRALRRARKRAPGPGAPQCPQPGALLAEARPLGVYELRSAVAGSRAMRPMRREVLPRLQLLQGHAGLGPELHRHRARLGRDARRLRQRGRGGRRAGLRQARCRAGRGRLGRQPGHALGRV